MDDEPADRLSRDARRGSGRKNAERSARMRDDLLRVARALFVANGFHATATPDIAAAAGVTRGALYHHFEDKEALFRAVVQAEAAAVAGEIEAASQSAGSPLVALRQGARGYFRAMADAGRVRLMLVDGPAVLGRAAMDRIDAGGPEGTLVSGLSAALGGSVDLADVTSLAAVLSGAFDRAVLLAADGGDRNTLEGACLALIDGLVAGA